VAVISSKQWGDDMASSRGVRAYTAALEAEPPVESRGRAPGQEVRGKAPLRLKEN